MEKDWVNDGNKSVFGMCTWATSRSDEEVQLKITTQYSSSVKLLKAPHSTTFNVVFTVE
jgi:hypothetical protein